MRKKEKNQRIEKDCQGNKPIRLSRTVVIHTAVFYRLEKGKKRQGGTDGRRTDTRKADGGTERRKPGPITERMTKQDHEKMQDRKTEPGKRFLFTY